MPGPTREGVVGALEFLARRQLEGRRRREGQARPRHRRRQRRGRLRARRAARRAPREVTLTCARVHATSCRPPVGDRGGARRGRHRQLLAGARRRCSRRTARSSACACSRACRSSTRRAASRRSSATSSPTCPCDVVVFAIGQAPQARPASSPARDLLLDERGNCCRSTARCMTTASPGVFACGEVVTGPGSAIALDRHRPRGGDVDPPLPDRARASPRAASTGRSRSTPRTQKAVGRRRRELASPRSRCRWPRARNARKDFRPVELGLHAHGGPGRGRALPALPVRRLRRAAPSARARAPTTRSGSSASTTPARRCVTRYDLDLSKCCFCGLCAEQCPTDALTHTGQYELSFYSPRPHAVRQGRDGPIGRRQPRDRCRRAEPVQRPAACMRGGRSDGRQQLLRIPRTC